MSKQVPEGFNYLFFSPKFQIKKIWSSWFIVHIFWRGWFNHPQLVHVCSWRFVLQLHAVFCVCDSGELGTSRCEHFFLGCIIPPQKREDWASAPLLRLTVKKRLMIFSHSPQTFIVFAFFPGRKWMMREWTCGKSLSWPWLVANGGKCLWPWTGTFIKDGSVSTFLRLLSMGRFGSICMWDWTWLNTQCDHCETRWASWPGFQAQKDCKFVIYMLVMQLVGGKCN